MKKGRIPSDVVWTLAMRFLDLAVTYDKDSTEVEKDPLNKLLLRTLEDLDSKMPEAVDKDFSARQIAFQTLMFSEIYRNQHYRAARDVQNWPKKLREELQLELKEKIGRPEPTLNDLLQAARGPAELAKIKVAELTEKSPRTIHSIKMDTEKRATKLKFKDRPIFSDEDTQEQALAKLFQVNQRLANAIVGLIHLSRAKEPAIEGGDRRLAELCVAALVEECRVEEAAKTVILR